MTLPTYEDTFSLFVQKVIFDRDIDILLLDLDNTIYRESDYLFRAYDQIARIAAPGDASVQQEIRMFMRAYFTECGRQGLFQATCEANALDTSQIPEWLELLRRVSVPGGLRAFRWIVDLIPSLETRTYILTNGHPVQQRNKHRQLRPSHLVHNLALITANDLAPKPSPLAIELLCEMCQVSPRQVLMIGDSSVDQEAALCAGVLFLKAPTHDDP